MLLLDGNVSHDIAEALSISEWTVKKHTANIYRKFNVTRRFDFCGFLLMKQITQYITSSNSAFTLMVYSSVIPSMQPSILLDFRAFLTRTEASEIRIFHKNPLFLQVA